MALRQCDVDHNDRLKAEAATARHNALDVLRMWEQDQRRIEDLRASLSVRYADGRPWPGETARIEQRIAQYERHFEIRTEALRAAARAMMTAGRNAHAFARDDCDEFGVPKPAHRLPS